VHNGSAFLYFTYKYLQLVKGTKKEGGASPSFFCPYKTRLTLRLDKLYQLNFMIQDFVGFVNAVTLFLQKKNRDITIIFSLK